MKIRCQWCINSEIEKTYHDIEWGIPVYDDSLLFEFLTLEGAQAGLNWMTILKKRKGYQKAFDFFDVQKISQYKQEKIDSLLFNSSIVRNKLKVNSVVINAKHFLEIKKEYGSFSKFIWTFVNDQPIQNNWKNRENIPVKTQISDMMSQSLKKKGFKFVGSTICYAFMQAMGMVNDHTVDCFRFKEVKEYSL